LIVLKGAGGGSSAPLLRGRKRGEKVDIISLLQCMRRNKSCARGKSTSTLGGKDGEAFGGWAVGEDCCEGEKGVVFFLGLRLKRGSLSLKKKELEGFR